MTERLRALLVLLAAVVAIKLLPEVYRWAAYGEERQQLASLRSRAVAAGTELVVARSRLDTLRGRIERVDRSLEGDRSSMLRYGGYADATGALPPSLYRRYVEQVDGYNRRVASRNADWEAYVAARERSRSALERYQAHADSARRLAARIGDPYYQVPSPIEAAAERGVVTPR